MTNPLANMRLRYLIGADGNTIQGEDGAVTVVPYDCNSALGNGIIAGYCNLNDEENSGKYGPYLSQDETAKQYGEGVIDPSGVGFYLNLRTQFSARQAAGFKYIYLDNAPSYTAFAVRCALLFAKQFDLQVIIGNPALCKEMDSIVAHPNVIGIVVEQGAGTPQSNHALRVKAGKPDMPIWFTAFEGQEAWAAKMASMAKGLLNIGVTISPKGEYQTAVDLHVPGQSDRSVA